MGATSDWLAGHLDPGPHGDVHEAGRQLQRRLQRSDPVRFDRLRFAILSRALVHGFKQHEHEVTALLRQEVLGQTGRPAGPTEPPSEDGLSDEFVPDGIDARSLPELVVLAIDELDRDEHWGHLAAEPRTRPIGWMATRIAWRVRDRLRNHQRESGRGPALRRHHRIAAWLEIVAEADPEHDGPVLTLRGVHRALLERITAHLDGCAEDTGPAFALRKLFPPQAWPPEDPGGCGILGRWLLGRLIARWAEPADWDATAPALAACWRTATSPPTVRAGLDAAADHHLRADTFPGLPEVGLWCGDDPWLGRKIGRLNGQIEPLVAEVVERIRAEVA